LLEPSIPLSTVAITLPLMPITAHYRHPALKPFPNHPVPLIRQQFLTMPKSTKQKEKSANSSGLDFEAQLWAAADKMRGHMDASEYKHSWVKFRNLQMKLAIRGIDANLCPRNADSSRGDLHPDLTDGFAFANF
jgi:hypothetical protein